MSNNGALDLAALGSHKVMAMGEVRRTEGGGWEVVVTHSAASQEAATRILARLEAAIDDERSDRGRRGRIDVDETDNADVQLARAFAYVERERRKGSGAGLVPVLVAIRTGRLQWHVSHWKGGLPLVSKFPGVLSQAEVSKAATTIQGELGELLDRRMPLKEALDRLAVWIDENNWQEAYDRHRTKRR